MSAVPAETEMMTVRVARNEAIAEGIHLLEFARPDGGELPEFTAGAHISIRAPNGLLRKYSLCNDPAEREHYLIAVKREIGGQGGSISLIDETKADDQLQISAPRNDFKLPQRSPGFIFIAGGIGITPIMSMIRHLKATGGPKFRLYYCTRDPASTAFRDELSVTELRGQVVIHHDQGDPTRSLDLWPMLEKPTGEHLYCCGPNGLMQAVRDMVGHWSPPKVHFEAFTAPVRTKPDDRPFMVRLERSGMVIEVPVGVTIMEAMRAKGLTVPSSCESGTCRTCKTKLLSGEPDHRDLALADHEKADNIMLCVSRARSDEIAIDR